MSMRRLMHKSSCVAAMIDYGGLNEQWATVLQDQITAINQAIRDLSAGEAIQVLKIYAQHYAEHDKPDQEHPSPQERLCNRRCREGCQRMIAWLEPVAEDDAKLLHSLPLSEETRRDTVRFIESMYDVHWIDAEAIFVLCDHGTYHPVAVMTEMFWHRLVD